ncbi:hypothetical protein [Nostoc sp.]|uniref:hypothetical protein n=1 Tax=Nostoc sp. TaxID=1180 RepID=UPI002FFB4129
MTSDRLSFQFTRILGLNQKSITRQEAAMLEAGQQYRNLQVDKVQNAGLTHQI